MRRCSFQSAPRRRRRTYTSGPPRPEAWRRSVGDAPGAGLYPDGQIAVSAWNTRPSAWPIDPQDSGRTCLRPRRSRYERPALPPLRAQRDQAAGHLARPVAELRRRLPARQQPRDPPPRLRPRDHPLRPGQQLRAALRQRGDQLRPDLRRGLRAPIATSWSISTKAGYDMWPGPYGEWGSRKYLLGSLDEPRYGGCGSTTSTSSTRTASIPETPLEETMGALDTAVRAGQGPLRRDLLLRPPADRGGGRAAAAARHAAADPPAVVLAAQPLGRG